MNSCRAILHVDMDAFYASVEQRDRPELRGKPLIVGGISGRGVVAAASYEVRRFGVRSAMPVSQALKLCPHALCVPPRMSRYKEVSRQIFAIFHEFTPLVEGLSLDEAFLDVSASLSLKGEPAVIAKLIKQRIAEQTALTASVGVATNKLVAKIASDLNKPDGLVVVAAAGVYELLDPLSVRRLPGLGRKLGAKVEAAGIATLGELRRAPDKLLWPLFGRYSQRMRERAGGIDERAVVADWAEKSISSEETFGVDIADPARLQAELARLADRVCARLRASNLVAANVNVKMRKADFTTFTRQRAIAPPTHDTGTIAAVARALLAQWLSAEQRVRLRLLGVGVSQLGPAEQLGLFAPGAAPEASALDGTLDAIRERFGMQSVLRASSIKGSR